jgi:hypothetical protein
MALLCAQGQSQGGVKGMLPGRSTAVLVLTLALVMLLLAYFIRPHVAAVVQRASSTCIPSTFSNS